MPWFDRLERTRHEGARANLGIKKGRYLFEVKVVEAHNPSEGRDSLGDTMLLTCVPRLNIYFF